MGTGLDIYYRIIIVSNSQVSISDPKSGPIHEPQR
jgi:hypothetical protein